MKERALAHQQGVVGLSDGGRFWYAQIHADFFFWEGVLAFYNGCIDRKCANVGSINEK
jgi:hypothetical protein